MTKPMSSIHSAPCLIIESIFSFVKINTLLFSKFFSIFSKSPVEILVLIFLPREIFSNFFNSVNFSAANARNGLR